MGVFDFLKKKKSITGVVRNQESSTPSAAEPTPPKPQQKSNVVPLSTGFQSNTSGFELTESGVMSVDPSRSASPGDAIDPRRPGSSGGRHYRDVGPGAQTTREEPTPSAGAITGTAAEREQQIQTYREQRRISPGDSSYGLWLPETERQDKIKRDVRQVQQFLGHSKLATTEIYTHVSPKDLLELEWNE